LMRLLQERLDVRWNAKIENLTTASGAKRFTADPERSSEIGPGIVVGADGVHSTVRNSLGLTEEFEMETLPYIVFNGRRRLTLAGLREEGLAKCFDQPNGIEHRQGAVVLRIRADFWNTNKDIARISYTLSRPAGAEDKSLIERNISDAETRASHFVEEVRKLGELPQPFAQAFNPSLMGKDRLLHWLMRSSLLDSATIEHHAKYRGVVLMGDAVHAQPIVGGAGACTAILDALQLAKHIRSANEVDTAAYLEARAGTWARDKQQAEESLRNLHAAETTTRAML